MNAPHGLPSGSGRSALVLAGGISMGAFEAGAYAALEDAGIAESIDCVAGSSIGAVGAAIIAGTPVSERVARLARFWEIVSADPTPLTSFWLGPPWQGLWRQGHNLASVVQTLLLGRSGLFQPRLAPKHRVGVDDVPALFDLAPLRANLLSLVDFDLLNSGSMRVALACTDVLCGERVVFDTARGDVIGPDHVLACCALLPLFAPIEIEGRLLADGGLASNAPVDIALSGPAGSVSRCFVVDLFAPQGSRPHTLAASASRAGDLAFANQTLRQIEAIGREHRLRALLARLETLLPADLSTQPEIAAILAEGCCNPPQIVHVSFRADVDEAGLGKPFDFSKVTVADRWRSGRQQMQAAIGQQGPAATAG